MTTAARSRAAAITRDLSKLTEVRDRARAAGYDLAAYASRIDRLLDQLLDARAASGNRKG